jgi:hypothetical protein
VSPVHISSLITEYELSVFFDAVESARCER